MADVFFDNPPILRGQAEDQLQQLYSYLGIISNQLNEALMTISIDQMTPETQTVIREGAAEQRQKEDRALRSLIIKTAEIVRTEMDEIRTTLQMEVNAVSDQFGAMSSRLTNEVELTSEGLQQAFTYIETLQSFQESSEEFQSSYNSYIHVGIVRYDGSKPIAGVAIGEGVTNPDGTINDSAKLATFTADRLSFYQGGTEIAYFSNNVLHVANVEVTRSLKMGNHTWLKLSDNSLGLMAGS